MIREADLDEAIAECQGERNPNASTCMKLAAYYIIKEHLYSNQAPAVQDVSYSYSSGDESGLIEYESDTEFGKIINRKKQAEVMPIIDEIIDTIRIVNPRLYDVSIRKLSE